MWPKSALTCRKSAYFRSASSDRDNKWFFLLGVGTTMLVRNYQDKRENGVVPDATSNEQPI